MQALLRCGAASPQPPANPDHCSAGWLTEHPFVVAFSISIIWDRWQEVVVGVLQAPRIWDGEVFGSFDSPPTPGHQQMRARQLAL